MRANTTCASCTNCGGINIICPSCGLQFSSSDALVHHFNTDGMQCISSLEDFGIPTLPTFVQGAEETNVTGKYDGQPRHLFGKGKMLLDCLKTHKHERHHKHLIYYPFADKCKWELAKFLALNLNKTQVSWFLKLQWFDTHAKPSFETANQLFGWLESLPAGPQWQSMKINTSGYKTTEEVCLIWHDSLEVMKDLFSNPMFVKYMTYSPQEVRCDEECEYSKFFTGTHAFVIQAQLPIRSTIVPIILASDKMPVTHQTGGLKMHPLFLTIGNIQSNIWMQVTSHVWCCIAFIPSPKFNIHADFQTILLACVFHWLLDMVTASLKVAAKDGTGLVNPGGNIQNCYTPLIIKLQNLGIHLPFWHNWMCGNPLYFLNREILHTGHKFFFNHILGWCKVAASSFILDTHFSSLHQCISFHHFLAIVLILDSASTVTNGLIHAIHALDPIHTYSSIAVMQQALMDFHSTKQSILNLWAQKGSSGAINHFWIPKLELMMSFWQQIKANGILMQYSTEVPEHLLIMHCKTTFQQTSYQVIEILNCEETLCLFNLYLILHQAEHSTIENVIDSENEEKESMFRGPHPFHNHFKNPNGFISDLSNVALHVTVQPDHKTLSMVDMQALYQLPDLPALLSYYIQSGLTHRWDRHGNLSTWNKFHIQLHSSFHTCFVEKSQVVWVYPPSEEHPLGYCDAVLLHHPGNSHTCGMG
ncbi:hypothetical protein V8B97DRAFT_2023063 [Scleroderma yunnanense]